MPRFFVAAAVSLVLAVTASPALAALCQIAPVLKTDKGTNIPITAKSNQRCSVRDVIEFLDENSLGEKSEFETSSAYEQRLDETLHSSPVGSLISGLFVIVISIPARAVTYDADHAQFLFPGSTGILQNLFSPSSDYQTVGNDRFYGVVDMETDRDLIFGVTFKRGGHLGNQYTVPVSLEEAPKVKGLLTFMVVGNLSSPTKLKWTWKLNQDKFYIVEALTFTPSFGYVLRADTLKVLTRVTYGPDGIERQQ